MLKCKHVADALADQHYDDLPKWKKIGLKLHVALCFVCGKFHKDVMLFQDCSRKLSEREEESGCTSVTSCLPDDFKERMKKEMAEHGK